MGKPRCEREGWSLEDDCSELPPLGPLDRVCGGRDKLSLGKVYLQLI